MLNWLIRSRRATASEIHTRARTAGRSRRHGHGPTPHRIQRNRTRGWRKPEGAVIVTAPTRWQNPHRSTEQTSEAHAEAVQRYRDDLLAGRLRVSVEDVRRELRGRDLCCYCQPDLPCHADVLLEVANRWTHSHRDRTSRAVPEAFTGILAACPGGPVHLC